MDDHVLRGMARWPNVPAVFGWLSLDRRGNWLLQGEPMANPVITAYIARNYAHDAEGRWYFQNGPQRVYVDLEYTPWVYRALNPNDAALMLESHTGSKATTLRGAWIDEDGTLLAETEHGVGVVHDRDLEGTLPSMTDAAGQPLSEDALEQGMLLMQEGHRAPVWLTLAGTKVQLEPVRAADVPGRFGFKPRPADVAPQDTISQ